MIERITKCLHFGYFRSYFSKTRSYKLGFETESYGKGLSLYHMVLHQWYSWKKKITFHSCIEDRQTKSKHCLHVMHTFDFHQMLTQGLSNALAAIVVQKVILRKIFPPSPSCPLNPQPTWISHIHNFVMNGGRNNKGKVDRYAIYTPSPPKKKQQQQQQQQSK